MTDFFKSPEYRLPILIMTVLLLLALFLNSERGKSERAAQEAAEHWGLCRDYSSKIIELKEKPVLVSSQTHSSAQIAQTIKSAMTFAEIPEENLVRVEPRSSKRIEKTPYLEQLSHLELQNITMEQLIRFLHRLSTLGQLEANDLRLRESAVSSPETTGLEYWNAEIILTNLIFAP